MPQAYTPASPGPAIVRTNRGVCPGGAAEAGASASGATTAVSATTSATRVRGVFGMWEAQSIGRLPPAASAEGRGATTFGPADPGAGGRIRTDDRAITNRLRYRAAPRRPR